MAEHYAVGAHSTDPEASERRRGNDVAVNRLQTPGFMNRHEHRVPHLRPLGLE
jgi:hypothetical protein